MVNPVLVGKALIVKAFGMLTIGSALTGSAWKGYSMKEKDIPYAKAVKVLCDMESEKWTDKDRTEAVEKVLSIRTLDLVQKKELYNALKWAWSKCGGCVG